MNCVGFDWVVDTDSPIDNAMLSLFNESRFEVFVIFSLYEYGRHGNCTDRIAMYLCAFHFTPAFASACLYALESVMRGLTSGRLTFLGISFGDIFIPFQLVVILAELVHVMTANGIENKNQSPLTCVYRRSSNKNYREQCKKP
jgi:hypothetical protein